MQELVFDLDGTLVDSMQAWDRAVMSVLLSRGMTPPKDLLRTIGAFNLTEKAEYFRMHFGVTASVDAILQEIGVFMQGQYQSTVPFKPYVEETLCALKAQGYRMHLLTASPHALIDGGLSRLHLDTLLEHTWSCDDFSHSKAKPELFLAVAEALHRAPSECVMLDDNLLPLQSAKKAGWGTIAVFDVASQDQWGEMLEMASFSLKSMDELPAVLSAFSGK